MTLDQWITRLLDSSDPTPLNPVAILLDWHAERQTALRWHHEPCAEGHAMPTTTQSFAAQLLALPDIPLWLLLESGAYTAPQVYEDDDLAYIIPTASEHTRCPVSPCELVVGHAGSHRAGGTRWVAGDPEEEPHA